jgi:hypothetical protein
LILPVPSGGQSLRFSVARLMQECGGATWPVRWCGCQCGAGLGLAAGSEQVFWLTRNDAFVTSASAPMFTTCTGGSNVGSWMRGSTTRILLVRKQACKITHLIERKAALETMWRSGRPLRSTCWTQCKVYYIR